MTFEKKLKKDDPRRTIAFYDDNLAFCQAEASRKHLSVTQYVNQLVDEARERRRQASNDSSSE